MFFVPVVPKYKSLLVIPALTLGFSFFAGSQWASSLPKSSLNQNINWYYDENEALELSRQSNRPVLIDMWAEWCEACKKMDATTFQDERVIIEALNNEWIFLKLDLTQSSDFTDDVQNRYQVQTLPALIMLSPSKSKPHQINGYVSAAKLVNHMSLFD